MKSDDVPLLIIDWNDDINGTRYAETRKKRRQRACERKREIEGKRWRRRETESGKQEAGQ